MGLNRTLRQRIGAILTHVTPTAPPVPVGCLPALFDKKNNQNHDFGPWPPWGPPWAPAALRDLREAHCTLVAELLAEFWCAIAEPIASHDIEDALLCALRLVGIALREGLDKLSLIHI